MVRFFFPPHELTPRKVSELRIVEGKRVADASEGYGLSYFLRRAWRRIERMRLGVARFCIASFLSIKQHGGYVKGKRMRDSEACGGEGG